MQRRTLATLALLTATGLAQQATPAPKKNPFEGFGKTGLDGPTRGTPKPAQAAPTTAPPAEGTANPGGIELAKEWWSGHTTQGAGGYTFTINDLEALMKGYGAPEADTAGHPDVTVYEGPMMDVPGAGCRVTYLMPLEKAEKVLFKSRGIVSGSRAVAPGFPAGLFLNSYDVRAGIYNRLCVLTDSSAEKHVVSLQLQSESAMSWYPPSPPWKKITRDWHTYDFVNTRTITGKQVIDVRVHDLRAHGHYVVVNCTGGFAEEIILPPQGVFHKPAILDESTWYVPEPLVKLILFSISKQLGRSGSSISQ